mgnify:CR=1 FL=1
MRKGASEPFYEKLALRLMGIGKLRVRYRGHRRRQPCPALLVQVEITLSLRGGSALRSLRGQPFAGQSGRVVKTNKKKA